MEYISWNKLSSLRPTILMGIKLHHGACPGNFRKFNEKLNLNKTSEERFPVIGLNKYKAGSSHRKCSVRKGVLRNFTKFRGKHLFLEISQNSEESTCSRVFKLYKKRDSGTGVSL